MASSLSWLDFSERERRQILDILELFRERDTRDEIGIGVIRDAFADLFFPGTSTIQTRARYFLFVAWLYKNLEKRKISATTIAKTARREEVNLIETLSDTEGPESGVIGYRARDKLKRLPSNVYWVGLQRWGICLYHGNQPSYQASVTRLYHEQNSRVPETDEDDFQPYLSNWHSALPDMPADFPAEASFHLTPVEAHFLQDRILISAPDSLLAHWVQCSTHEPVRFLWEYPEALPSHLQLRVEHARIFSLVIHGAQLLYNLMLAEKEGHTHDKEALVTIYRDGLDAWAEAIASEADCLRHWDRNDFWQTALLINPRISISTRDFANAWIDLALTRSADISDLDTARQLIDQRELRLKGSQSRLHNPVALKAWQGSAGAGRLTYRWEIAQTILKDIMGALYHA